jgi:hypothetical protein
MAEQPHLIMILHVEYQQPISETTTIEEQHTWDEQVSRSGTAEAGRISIYRIPNQPD